MTRTFFGTDGIRGTANTSPMTADIALRVGRAAGRYFNRGSHRHRVVIAKDTRLSGYMIEPALTAGFISTGMDVILVGPLPTPAVAMLTTSMRADIGVMISASHNPFHDNGIKLFGPDGYKLSDSVEKKIESLMAEDESEGLAKPENLGRARRLEDARGRYIEFAKSTFPKHLKLDGMKIVIDCAHGAAYQVAPVVLRELGAEVIALGVDPNGCNINDNCGSTHPETLCKEVVAHQAHLGIALDGDADRVVLADEKGALIDGDQLIALVATYWQKAQLLKGGAVVATHMSNMGLEKYLATLNVKLLRTQVGDRYVMEEMRKHSLNVGGEQSGHIILSDHATTGDGLVAALQALAVLVSSNQRVSEAGRLFIPLPQILKNVRYTGISPLEKSEVKMAIAQGEKILQGSGRLFIRASGTEPLIRVMAEGDDARKVENVVDTICRAAEKAA